ncbi:MAG: hypothetical protein EWV60_23205 [Microcystis sp. Msp_OC_L_20101000_S702]|uniref:hypothetical protein n=1 Tax=Microcystis sp. Msp_OC_L_20101000_S702 TaxID=2486218 RepID=UPI00118EC888|nr:hypothetical protein [Microcystis sp. Msp_OC_L_20101000_S702]TRU03008.1 MAG: hypothetical protein EWV60_23205 [Microcystis sp. Msp_OC_L_20101000_S702]
MSTPDAINRVEVTGIPGQGTRALVRILRDNLELYAKQSIGSMTMFSHRTAVGSGKFVAFLLGIPFGILHRLGYLSVVLSVVGIVVCIVSGSKDLAPWTTAFFSLAITLYVLVRYAVEPVFRYVVATAKSVIARRAQINRFHLSSALERGIRNAKNERELFHGYLGLADTALDVMEPGDQNSQFREDIWVLMGAFAESKLMDTTARKNLPTAMVPDRKPLVTLIRWMCMGCGLLNEKDRDAASRFLKANSVALSSTANGQSQWDVFSGRYGTPDSSRAHRVRIPSRTALDDVTSLIFGVERSPAKVDYAPLESRLFGGAYASIVNQIIEYRVRSYDDADRDGLDELKRQIFETTTVTLGLPNEEEEGTDRILSISGVQDPLLAKIALSFRDDVSSEGQRQG